MIEYGIRKHNNGNNGKFVGKLSYDDKHNTFGIDIDKNVDPNDLPIYLYLNTTKGKFTLNDKESRRWLSERLTSPHRQNIGSILKSMNLMVYDENEFIKRNNGRCSQDDFEIIEIKHDT